MTIELSMVQIGIVAIVTIGMGLAIRSAYTHKLYAKAKPEIISILAITGIVIGVILVINLIVTSEREETTRVTQIIDDMPKIWQNLYKYIDQEDELELRKAVTLQFLKRNPPLIHPSQWKIMVETPSHVRDWDGWFVEKMLPYVDASVLMPVNEPVNVEDIVLKLVEAIESGMEDVESKMVKTPHKETPNKSKARTNENDPEKCNTDCIMERKDKTAVVLRD